MPVTQLCWKHVFIAARGCPYVSSGSIRNHFYPQRSRCRLVLACAVWYQHPAAIEVSHGGEQLDSRGLCAVFILVCVHRETSGLVNKRELTQDSRLDMRTLPSSKMFGFGGSHQTSLHQSGNRWMRLPLSIKSFSAFE